MPSASVRNEACWLVACAPGGGRSNTLTVRAVGARIATMASASEDPLRDAVRDWLSGDEEGRHILEKLASDPIDGTQLLMARLQGDQTPEAITAAVSGGQ